MNPLYLKYFFANANIDLIYNNSLSASIRLILPVKSQFKNKHSSLFMHSLRCHNIAKIYGFSDYLCKALLYHNIYGTDSLDSMYCNEYLYRSVSNRASICALLGAEIELMIYQYSFLNQKKLIKSALIDLPSNIQIMYFINTLEIISSIQNINTSFYKNKIAMHIRALKFICTNSRIDRIFGNQMFSDFSLIESCLEDNNIDVK